MTDKIKQQNISVKNGSVVGRDQYNIEVHGGISQMTKLSIAFMDEAKQRGIDTTILPDLEHFMSKVDVDKVIGLEAKLLAASRGEDLQEATRQKEIVAKKLHQHATSKAAQKIYILILGMLLYNFRAFIKPLIDDKASNSEITQAVLKQVIEPCIDKLEDNVLEMFYDDIWGMIYYLTGNCHIKWAK